MVLQLAIDNRRNENRLEQAGQKIQVVDFREITHGSGIGDNNPHLETEPLEPFKLLFDFLKGESIVNTMLLQKTIELVPGFVTEHAA